MSEQLQNPIPIIKDGLHQVWIEASTCPSAGRFFGELFQRNHVENTQVVVLAGPPGRGKTTLSSQILYRADQHLAKVYPDINDCTRRRMWLRNCNWENAQTLTIWQEKEYESLSVDFKNMDPDLHLRQADTFGKEIRSAIMLGGYLIVEVPWPARAYGEIWDLFSRLGDYSGLNYDPAMIYLAGTTGYQNFHDHERGEFSNPMVNRIELLRNHHVPVLTGFENQPDYEALIQHLVGGGELGAVMRLRQNFDEWLFQTTRILEGMNYPRIKFDQLNPEELKQKWIAALRLEIDLLGVGKNRFLSVVPTPVLNPPQHLGLMIATNHTFLTHREHGGFADAIIRQGFTRELQHQLGLTDIPLDELLAFGRKWQTEVKS